jgi:hypothetical protein
MDGNMSSVETAISIPGILIDIDFMFGMGTSSYSNKHTELPRRSRRRIMSELCRYDTLL